MMRNLIQYLIIMLIFTTLTSCSDTVKKQPTPPIASKKPKVDTIHNEILVDDYFWLREKSNPEVIAYLEAENAYTDSMTSEIKPFVDSLYSEIKGRIKEKDMSVPYQNGNYSYYTRFEEGKQYGIYCRKSLLPEGKEEVILDLNVLGEGLKFISLGDYEVSPNGEMLAYSLDTTGFRQYLLQFKNLKTGETLPISIERVTSVAWASDNATFFYSTEDAVTKRSDLVYQSSLLNHSPKKLYEERDELFQSGVGNSRDKQFIFIYCFSSETSEFRYLQSSKPFEEFKVVIPRQTKHEYTVDHRNGLFYLRTNKNAKNFKIVSAPFDSPEEKNWVEVIPHRPEVKIESFALFENFLSVSERKNGLQEIEVLNFTSMEKHSITFPEPTYSAYMTPTPEYKTNLLRFSYQSFVTPNSIYDYNMDSRERTMLKQQEVVGGYDASLYTSERVFATALDGTQIPISIVYKKGTKRNGTAPLLLYGYGSYGISMSSTFSISRLSLLQRGVIYALAHIRGGGEMGEEWHDNGKMMNKKNTFTDFIDCADYLVKNKYSDYKQIAIEGGSAGGLLIGAVLNLRPDICKVAHLAVPFVDVINTMLDASLPLTTGEYIEWGNPNEKEAFTYMKSYCPYSNIERKKYPSILITTSLNDSQVMYWEPAKYAAKMRAFKAGDEPLLLKTNMGAGHGGSSGRFDRIKEFAFEYGYMMSQLGIKK
ncbi:MAG: S9 family peptidase [Chloroherpetonaceae bacterium]|nr:S9 family peptidase [Chloroherpetonaceae bacterium]